MKKTNAERPKEYRKRKDFADSHNKYRKPVAEEII